MNRPALIPTEANAEAAWERYTAIARAMIDDPALFVQQQRMGEFARAWEEWRDLFLALDKKC